MKKENFITMQLQQNWENISGVSEKARAIVKVNLIDRGLTIDGNSDRFEAKPVWISLSKEDAVLIAKQIIAFYENQ